MSVRSIKWRNETFTGKKGKREWKRDGMIESPYQSEYQRKVPRNILRHRSSSVKRIKSQYYTKEYSQKIGKSNRNLNVPNLDMSVEEGVLDLMKHRFIKTAAKSIREYYELRIGNNEKKQQNTSIKNKSYDTHIKLKT